MASKNQGRGRKSPKRVVGIRSVAALKYDVKQIGRAVLTGALIERLYSVVAKKIAETLPRLDENVEVDLRARPDIKRVIDREISQLSINVQTTIQKATEMAWSFAAAKEVAVISEYFKARGVGTVPAVIKLALRHRNITAMQEFNKRRQGEDGLTLSRRVWRYTSQYKEHIEKAIGGGFAFGESAAKRVRKLREYLADPEGGEAGVGVYKSAAKNAMRLARTEVNIAYRKSDIERWRSNRMILGYEIRRSNNEYPCDLCETLKGRYPKDFEFIGWHPNCRCHMVPIIIPLDKLSDEDMLHIADPEWEFRGKDGNPILPITDTPDSFNQWVSGHQDFINKERDPRRVPYFLRDNAARIKYQSYGEEYIKEAYYPDSKGFVVVHKRHNFARTGGGGDAERKVAHDLAKLNGKEVEFLSEGERKSPDLFFDGVTWDVKYINGANEKTMRNYLRDARKANGGAIFYWDKGEKSKTLKSACRREYGRLRKEGREGEFPRIFFMGNGKLVELEWR